MNKHKYTTCTSSIVTLTCTCIKLVKMLTFGLPYQRIPSYFPRPRLISLPFLGSWYMAWAVLCRQYPSQEVCRSELVRTHTNRLAFLLMACQTVVVCPFFYSCLVPDLVSLYAQSKPFPNAKEHIQVHLYTKKKIKKTCRNRFGDLPVFYSINIASSFFIPNNSILVGLCYRKWRVLHVLRLK